MANSSAEGVLERLLQHFHVLARELERQVKFEEVSTKVSDPNDPDYSMFALSARKRRDNILASISRLEMELHLPDPRTAPLPFPADQVEAIRVKFDLRP